MIGGPIIAASENRLATAPCYSPWASGLIRCDMNAFIVGITIAAKNQLANRANIIQVAVARPNPAYPIIPDVIPISAVRRSPSRGTRRRITIA